MAGEVNTIGTVLKYGSTAENVAKLTAIKDYPDLGGAPEMIPVTDLDDDTERSIPGIVKLGAMEFTSNYNGVVYTAIAANSRTAGYYSLEFGLNGADGIFTFQGQHTVYITGGGVGAPREMKITIAPSTKVTQAVDAVVTLLALGTLVTAPVKAAVPSITAIDTTQYTGTIAWFATDGVTPLVGNFAASTVYVAKVTLTAKAKFTMVGVLANSFTYTGATTVTNLINSGLVTITFPVTAV